MKGDTKNVRYDATQFTAKVEVTVKGGVLSYAVTYLKDGVPYGGDPAFLNRYDPPQTGDHQAQLIALLAIASLSLGGVWLAGRRRKENQ